MENTSPRFKINWTDIYKTLRGAFITLLAVGGAAVISYIQDRYQGFNYNVCVAVNSCFDLAFLAVPVIGGLIEIARRWFVDFRNK